MNIEKSKDFSLDSGERQTGTNIHDIRADHLLRYEFAVEIVKQNECYTNQCLDIFCGNGYGTFLMSEKLIDKKFYGIDGSEEAITSAKRHYSLTNSKFSNKIFPFDLDTEQYDFVTCFESIEHVKEDIDLLQTITNSMRNDGILIISVPNENLNSITKNPHPFHFRHYTHSQMLDLLKQSFELINWYGQNTYIFDKDGTNTFQLISDSDMRLVEKVEGQVNIYIAKKISD
jgi:2-polyprenyl-3-methyl-5-hydroxy-6-metoxy-1,4-benzoquinol methylase